MFRPILKPLIFLALFVNLFTAMALAYAGPLKQMIFGHDAWVTLDGAWKVTHGLSPHHDFYSPLGLMNFIPAALSILIVGPSIQALANAAAMWILFATLMTLGVFRSNLDEKLLAGLLFFVGVSTAATQHIGFDYTATTYAASYNRYGCALMGLLTFALLSEGFTLDRIARGCLALCLTTLFFLKITYFLGGIGVLGLGAAVKRTSIRNACYILATTVGLTALTLLCFSINPLSIYNDLMIAAEARSTTLMDPFDAIKLLAWPITSLLLIVACSFGLSMKQNAKRKDLFVTLAISASLLILMISLFRTNPTVRAFGEIPYANTVCLFLIVDMCRRASPRYRKSAITAATCAFIFWPSSVLRDIPGLIYAIKNTLDSKSDTSVVRFQSDSIRGLLIDGNGGDPPIEGGYTAKINDGLAMLRAHVARNSRVMSIDFTDIFAFALQWPPPVGAPLFWQSGFSYTESSAPAAVDVFEGADAVMVPKIFGTGNMDDGVAITKLYGPYINENFISLADSSYWRLFVRRTQ